MSSYVHTVLRITYKFLNSQAKWWQVVSWRITGCWIRNLLPLSPLLPSTYIFSVALQLQLPNKKPRQQEKKVNGIESLNLCRNKVRGVTSGEVKTRTAQRVRQAKKNHTLAFIYTVCTVVVNCHAAGGHTHTHTSKGIAGDLRASYIPLTHTNTHMYKLTLSIGASKNLSALSPPQCTIRQIKTEIKTILILTLYPHSKA